MKVNSVDGVNDGIEDGVKDSSDKDIELKIYKEKPYLNSSKEPFGLTLNGKSPEYIAAHGLIKGLLIKGKVIATKVGKMKILEASANKTMVNATIEATDNDDKFGNAELKVYNPSISKRKGATIEIRKLSDYEYEHVETLRNIVICLLDSFIDGDEANIITKEIKNKISGLQQNKQKLFKCDVCDWQTNFGAALKGHLRKIHNKTENNEVKFDCDECVFKAINRSSLMAHMRNKHNTRKPEPSKRCKAMFICEKR